MMDVLFLVALIFIAALLYSSVGHGGASGYLAAMALLGVAPASMKPAALVLNILVASIGTVRFARAGCVPWRLLMPFVIASVPLAFLGGAMQLPAPAYKQVLGAVLLVAAVNLWFRPGAKRGHGEPVRMPPTWLALLVGAAIGFVSGLVGVGGGIFLSPVILLAGWADPRRTAGASAAFILLNSISGLAGNIRSVQLLPPDFVLWAASVVAGGLLGSWLGALRLANPVLRRLLAVVLVIAGLKMILS